MVSYKILIVDDFAGFRHFIYSTLQQRPELQIIGEAPDGLEALEKAKELQPDLILLDIGMPKLNGLETAKRLTSFAPNARILFVSQETSPDVVQEALQSRGRGYVNKLLAVRDLLPAIDAVLQGEQFISGGLEISSSTDIQTPHSHEGLLSDLPVNPLSLNQDAGLSEAVARAIAMTGADKGNLQILDTNTDSLHIIAQHGFSTGFLEFFAHVQHRQGSCGTALARAERVIVDDVMNDPIFRGTESRDVVLREDIRAVQSIPLTTAAGQMVGVLSTHFLLPKPSRHKLFAVTDKFVQEVAELIRLKLLVGG